MSAIFSYPSFSIYKNPSFGAFEIAARDCYRSHDKMRDGSDKLLFERILKNNHTAMVEFMDDLAVRFKTSRGVTHELVRQRLCSFAQSSTRYIKYDEVEFILPWWADNNSMSSGELFIFTEDCVSCANAYSRRLSLGWPPQKARGCLNNDVSSHINMKTNIREWVHIFGLRTDSAAHPDMRIIMCGLLLKLVEINFIFKEIVERNYEFKKNLEWFSSSYTLKHQTNEFGVDEFVIYPLGSE